ncbi:MFS transporter [Nonomuraea sp. LP-02]|uniref:MFS transporter n=1 Tax=Nonomuraea sp. LP-02 TaxID=3097960 RepID=UPI002E2F797C|nr:MFS transporter [Nonomuraea sp. LP-02]MED7931437.1 MFS transporter [Nonomuraea sp. LP-02]
MTTTRPVQPHIAEPSVPGTSMTYLGGSPFRRYLLLYILAMAGITAVYGGVGAVILPLQVQDIEFAHWFTGPDATANLQQLTNLKAQIDAGAATATAQQRHQLDLLASYEAARASSLSIVTAVGSIATMFVQSIAGLLSDRTRSRWGRRAPWIAGGAVLGAALIIGARYSAGIGLLIATWALAQLAINAAQGALGTTVPDRIPHDKLGTVSALSGIGTLFGALLGSVAAGTLFGAMGLDAYFPFALALAVTGLLFVLIARDRSSTGLRLPPANWLALLKSYVIPLRSADFRWVCVASVTMMFSYGASNAFSLYMMQSYIQPALSAAEATRLIPLMSLTVLPGTLVAMLVTGRLSDRIGRRKPFVIGASALFAVSMLVPLLWPTLASLFVQNVIAGLAAGCYLAVDRALLIDVLPDKQAAGRDLGLGSMSFSFGQAVGPVVAGQLVALTGGYGVVWVLSLLTAVAAAAAIMPVKKVR